MSATKFGAGTVTYTVGAGPAASFQQEVKGGGIEHEYTEVGEDTTYLDGITDPAGEVRGDTLTLDCDFNLGSAGFYAFLFTNDLQDADVVFTPSATVAAKWEGTVRLKLPEGAAAEEFAGKIGGTVKHKFVGPVEFTPGV